MTIRAWGRWWWGAQGRNSNFLKNSCTDTRAGWPPVVSALPHLCTQENMTMGIARLDRVPPSSCTVLIRARSAGIFMPTFNSALPSAPVLTSRSEKCSTSSGYTRTGIQFNIVIRGADKVEFVARWISRRG